LEWRPSVLSVVRNYLLRGNRPTWPRPTTKLIYVIFGCVCAAILAALFYATNPSYMLGAILVGVAANAVLFWALMKTGRPV
jgi:uncharacterized membrane protein YccC